MPVRLTQLYHCVFVNTPSEFRWRFISCFVFVLCLLSLVLCHPCVVLWQTNVRVILYFCAVRSIPYRFVTRASSLTCSLFVFGVIIFLCCPPLFVSRALSLHTILIIRYFFVFQYGISFLNEYTWRPTADNIQGISSFIRHSSSSVCLPIDAKSAKNIKYVSFLMLWEIDDVAAWVASTKRMKTTLLLEIIFVSSSVDRVLVCL